MGERYTVGCAAIDRCQWSSKRVAAFKRIRGELVMLHGVISQVNFVGQQLLLTSVHAVITNWPWLLASMAISRCQCNCLHMTSAVGAAVVYGPPTTLT